jgi:hypothetical protein
VIAEGLPDRGVIGNERLTALAGAVLLVLLAIEVATTLRLRSLMPAHVFVGVLLVGPLLLKLGSTGYRFARYYTGATPYVRRGPPTMGLRILAVPLVVTTLVLVGSGGALLLIGPGNPGPLIPLHNISTLIWLPLAAVHVAAYVRRLPRLTIPDVTRWQGSRRSTSRARLGAAIALVVLGTIGAVVLLPSGAPWLAWAQSNEQVPAPIIVGTVLSLAAVVLARARRSASASDR